MVAKALLRFSLLVIDGRLDEATDLLADVDSTGALPSRDMTDLRWRHAIASDALDTTLLAGLEEHLGERRDLRADALRMSLLERMVLEGHDTATDTAAKVHLPAATTSARVAFVHDTPPALPGLPPTPHAVRNCFTRLLCTGTRAQPAPPRPSWMRRTPSGGADVPVDASRVDLPARPGVYLFKTSQGRVLYVGKATRLSDRVRAYFASTPDRAMIPELVARADDIECIVTPTPQEALVLERQLIREHRPRFNSLLKDDKSFPYLVLTGEALPRIMYTRHPPKGAQKWGPFPNPAAAKQVMQLLRRNLGIRDCKELLPQGCLAMHIGLCAGPCIDAEGYLERVETARKILNGQATELLEELALEMDQAADAHAYEHAAVVRDRIRAVREVISQHVVSSRLYRDSDAIGVAVQGDLAAVVVLHADEGIVQAQDVWPMVHRGDLGETVSAFVADHYEARRPPRLLLTPVPLLDGVEAWLEERRGAKVDCRVPMRGDLATLRRLADQNAEVQVGRLARRGSGSLEQRAADDGAVLLGLDRLDHVVCFDMAQLQGEERVGASVVLRNGRPAKKEYRTYTVKGDAMDDLRMMQEVVQRWLKRQDEWPDLLLLDGGQTHLDAIKRTLEEAKVWGRFEVAALAKREETVFREGHDPIVLDRNGRVLVHARDEAHRFVNRFHRKRRGRSTMEDPLESVEGLGAKKMQALLRHFGGRKGIEHASLADLQTVPGIGKALAERLHERLHGSTT